MFTKYTVLSAVSDRKGRPHQRTGSRTYPHIKHGRPTPNPRTPVKRSSGDVPVIRGALKQEPTAEYAEMRHAGRDTLVGTNSSRALPSENVAGVGK